MDTTQDLAEARPLTDAELVEVIGGAMPGGLSPQNPAASRAGRKSNFGKYELQYAMSNN